MQSFGCFLSVKNCRYDDANIHFFYKNITENLLFIFFVDVHAVEIHALV